MNDITVLQRMGLSEKETKSYLLALDLGSLRAGDLIKKLNVYSKTAYELLNKLVEKGFFSYVESDHVKTYFPLQPRKLNTLLEEKMDDLAESKRQLQVIMPNLQERARQSPLTYHAS